MTKVPMLECIIILMNGNLFCVIRRLECRFWVPSGGIIYSTNKKGKLAQPDVRNKAYKQRQLDESLVKVFKKKKKHIRIIATVHMITLRG